MNFGALTVALAFRCVLRPPPVVIRRERGAIPRTLLHHLRDGRIVQLQAVLDGIATAVKGAMQPDSVISVAGHLSSPAVGFIDYSFDLLQRERWLRLQPALRVNPGAMRHVDLDPVGAVAKLLARGLAEFDWDT